MGFLPAKTETESDYKTDRCTRSEGYGSKVIWMGTSRTTRPLFDRPNSLFVGWIIQVYMRSSSAAANSGCPQWECQWAIVLENIIQK